MTTNLKSTFWQAIKAGVLRAKATSETNIHESLEEGLTELENDYQIYTYVLMQIEKG